MTEQRDLTIGRLLRAAFTPALEQALHLAKSEETRFVGDAPATMAAGEALRIWSVRLKVAEATQSPVQGLAALVSNLKHLQPDQVLEQVTLKQGPLTGVVFFDAVEEAPVGVAITERTLADEQRAWENLARAQKASPVAKQPKRKAVELERVRV